MKLSVVIVARNEEEMIGDCIRSVVWADEVIVVDDLSCDQTVKIAKRLRARVFKGRMDALGKQKQFGLKKAKGDWILALDADERVSKELGQEIREALANPSFDAYNIYFHQFFLNEPLVTTLHGGHPRLFKKGAGWFSSDPVHEGPFVDVEMGQFENPIIHYSHRSIFQLIEKFNLFTDKEAEVLSEAGIESNWLRLILAPFYTFVRRQWKEKDFLSGMRGLVLSYIFSLYTLMKWVKVWERRKVGV